MPETDVNYLAALIATLAGFLLGWVWYAPPVFGRRWMALNGYTEQDLSGARAPALVISLIATFVLVTTLAYVLDYANADTIAEALKKAAFLWLGFVATINAVARVYSTKRSFGLWAIDSGFWLAVMLIAGAILGAWQ